MNGACNGIFLLRPLGPLGGVKGQISLNFQLKSQFERFLYKTLYVFSQIKNTNHIRRDFYSVAWVMPNGRDFGALWCQRGSKIYFFKDGHVAYQIDGDDEYNRMHVKFSFYGQTGDLAVRSKGQLSLNLGYRVHFNGFIPTCVRSHKQKIENVLNRIFILLSGSCPGVGLGGAGESKTIAWGYAMAHHRLRALVHFNIVQPLVCKTVTYPPHAF